MVDSAFRSTCDVLDVEGKVVQLNDYYPFGLPYSDTGSMKGTDIQPYKYNGKEFQTMHGLHWYDYGARMYDPIICRWNAVDPLAEKFYNVTPYCYCGNNPVNAIDPDGRFPYKWQAKLSRWFYNLFHKTNASPIHENREAQNSRYPMSVVGNAVSSFGSGMEMVLDFANGDYGNSIKGFIYKGGEKLVGIGLKKVLPGYGKKIGEEGFDLGTEVIRQGVNLKLSGAERLTDKLIEEKENIISNQNKD